MSDAAIEIPVRLSADQAEAQLVDFAKVARLRAVAAGDALEQEGTRGFEGFLKTWRAEEKQQSRYTRFLAGELQSLLPIGSELGQTFGKVAVIFSQGLGIGLAFELVKLGAETITDVVEHQKKLEEETQAFKETTAKAIREMAAEWDDYARHALLAHQQAGDAETRHSDNLAKLRREAEELGLAYDKALKKKEEMGTEGHDSLLDLFRTGSVNEAAEKAQREFQAAQSKLAIEEELFRQRGYWEDRYKLTQTANEQLRALELAGAKLTAAPRRAIEIETQEEIRKIRAEWIPKNAEYAAILEEQARRNGAARILQLEQELARSHAAAMRQLRDELAAFDQTDEERVAAQGEAKMAALWNEYEKAGEKKDGEAQRRILERLNAQNEVNIQAAIRAAFKVAKAASDAEREGERVAQDTQADVDDQNAELRRKAQLLAQAGWRKDVADRIDAIQKEQDEELSILASAQEQGVIGHEEYEARKTEITQRYSQMRQEALRKESALDQSFSQLGQAMVGHMSQVVGSAFSSMATHSAAYERALIATGRAHQTTASEAEGAMWAQVQSVLAAAAAQAEVEAVLNLGRGFAALASFNYKSAGEYFTAAAILGTVGGVAAAAGYAIGEFRPMTNEERQGVTDAAAGYYPVASARDAGAGSSNAALPARETIILIGDPFEGPAETARRAARAVNLAKQLDLMQRDA